MLTWTLLALEIVLAPRANSAGFAAGVDAWTYLLNQAVIITRYLQLVFWPSDLVITYGAPVPYQLRDVFPQALFVVALLVFTAAAFRWKPPAAFAGAFAFITLAPASSIIPIATEVGAERRMYLPLMAIIALVATVAYLAMRQAPRTAAVATLVAAVLLGSQTIARNREYQSWSTMAQTTLQRWPSDAAHAAVGTELSRVHRDEDALPLLRIGARSDPRARYNLGVALFNLGRYDEAIRELDVLVGGYPMREEVPWARRVMGHSYARLSKWPEAVAQLRMVLAMTPHDAEARRMLVDAYDTHGVDLAQTQRYEAAIGEFRRGLELNENDASLRYNLATALFDAGKLGEAFIEAERAVAVDPANADAHHLIGKLLALQGKLQQGQASLETALQLRPDDGTIREDLQRIQMARKSQK
jgi:tetratricopeptide (TPR) repeat protein